jgi:phosphotriesterase-related protein
MLSRDALRGKAQTVLGIVDPATLGSTLMHEHLIWDIRPPSVAAEPDQGLEITLCNCFRVNYGRWKVPSNLVLRCRDTATREVAAMMQAGGRTIVELTCGGLKPDPEGLAEIAQRTNALIVMGCGHYVHEFQDPANEARSVDSLAVEMIGQVLEGAWATKIRAGIIGEIGCQVPWTDLEKRVLRAALIAQEATGAAVNVHPGRISEQPQQIAHFVLTHGGRNAIDRVIISHIDRTIFDEGDLLRLADTGCVIEFDLFGREQSFYRLADIDMPNDAVRLRYIRSLIEHGHLEQVVISHDICHRTRLTSFGGHGYGHIHENVVPLMRSRGFSQREIDAILIDNPRRLLTFA